MMQHIKVDHSNVHLTFIDTAYSSGGIIHLAVGTACIVCFGQAIFNKYNTHVIPVRVPPNKWALPIARAGDSVRRRVLQCTKMNRNVYPL